MPNHVTNILHAPKEVLDFLIPDKIVTDWQDKPILVDFGKVLPAPPDDDPVFTCERSEYKNDAGEVTGVGYGLIGYSPLDWMRQHWGTKWNAYDTVRMSETELRFDTAWSHPYPVILALSERFPDSQIVVLYADEDLGHNAGIYAISNGLAFTEKAAGEPSGLEFAAQVKYGQTHASIEAENAAWEAEQSANEAAENE